MLRYMKTKIILNNKMIINFKDDHKYYKLVFET